MTTSETDPIAGPVPVQGFSARVVKLLQRRATWVLIDQGVVSAGNFLTANLIGRNVPKGEFGSFQFLIETILYLNSLQAAIVIYPLTIKGATGDRESLGRLSTISMLLTVILLPLLGPATIVTAGSLHVWQIAISAILALVFWQLQETLRRALISDLRYADAVWGDSISYLGQALVVGVLAYFKALNLNTIFLAMAGTSVAAMGVQSLQLGLRRVNWSQVKSTVVEFWSLGKWVLLTNSSALITSLGYWWVLNYKDSAEALGVFGAIVALFKLANPIMSSMSGLIVPAVARASAQSGSHAATRVAMKYILFGAVLLAPYFLLLALFPKPLLTLAYGSKSPYVQEGLLLRLFTVNYTMVYLATVFGAWLNGLGRTRYNFYVQVVNIVTTLLIGLPMTWHGGPKGLVVGGLIVTVSCGVCLAFFIHRTIKSFEPPKAA